MSSSREGVASQCAEWAVTEQSWGRKAPDAGSSPASSTNGVGSNGMLKLEGKTVDGKLVFSGVYRLYETHGIPFNAIFESLDQRGALPDWVALIREARAAGVKPGRAIAKIHDAVSDVFGPKIQAVVIGTLEKVVELDLLDYNASTEGK